ncbi:hypothetical protein ABFV99_00605 [Cytobacillus horneckiae]|uniref:hypothetical protein n=1 Tax=Cytobacillus horneckiae TaxID=549687 RepID=UPI0034CDB30A
MTNDVYIPTIEGAIINENKIRDKKIHNLNHEGSIPDSLLLRKLRQNKNYIEFGKRKNFTHDIINVKFSQSTKSGKQLISTYEKLIVESNDDQEIQRLEYLINKIVGEMEKHPISNKWIGKSAEEIRYDLYNDGFTIKLTDYETGEISETEKYVLLGRSPAKSRKGEAWFIKENLHDYIKTWMRLGLNFDNDTSVDLAGILSYETLVASSIVDTVKIDPDSILIVDSVYSTFKKDANIIGIEKKDAKILANIPKEKWKITNEIFDGEALADVSLFEGEQEGKGFMLLRQLFFKAACFNVRLTDFLSDYADANGKDFDSWEIEDMFGNKIPASKIKLIINPSCLKILKYSYACGSKKEIYEHWRKTVKNNESSLWGICKSEKETKRGFTDDNQPLQRMSYQMINSLPIKNKADINKISKYEYDYIMDLKNKPKKFIDYLITNKNNVNANEMFAALYDVNPKIIESKIFRDFKKSTIKKYKENLQSGKLRVTGDYCVMGSCLVEYLMKVVGEIKGNEINEPLCLKGNEIYTTLFEPGELVGFRNPHVSPSNLLYVDRIKLEPENKYHNYLKYFNLTKNIVVVNSIGFEICDILNGCDWDSDVVFLSNDSTLTKIIKKSIVYYKVIINDIPEDKESDEVVYRLVANDMAKIDNKLSKSKTEIGEIVNLSQLIMSLYWDEMTKDKPDKDKVENLLGYTNILSILSGLSIDSAKRQYKVDAKKQLNMIRNKISLKFLDKKNIKDKKLLEYVKGLHKDVKLKAKPLFWKYVHNDKLNKKQKNNKSQITTYYNCPMDMVYERFSKLEPAEGSKDNIKLYDLLQKNDKRKANRRQTVKVKSIADETSTIMGRLYKDFDDKDELMEQLDRIMDEQQVKFDKIKINKNTMYAILLKIAEETEGKKEQDKNNEKRRGNWVRLMNHLYKSRPQLFLDSFKHN